MFSFLILQDLMVFLLNFSGNLPVIASIQATSFYRENALKPFKKTLETRVSCAKSTGPDGHGATYVHQARWG